jgi:hypothetical protein
MWGAGSTMLSEGLSESVSELQVSLRAAVWCQRRSPRSHTRGPQSTFVWAHREYKSKLLVQYWEWGEWTNALLHALQALAKQSTPDVTQSSFRPVLGGVCAIKFAHIHIVGINQHFELIMPPIDTTQSPPTLLLDFCLHSDPWTLTFGSRQYSGSGCILPIRALTTLSFPAVCLARIVTPIPWQNPSISVISTTHSDLVHPSLSVTIRTTRTLIASTQCLTANTTTLSSNILLWGEALPWIRPLTQFSDPSAISLRGPVGVDLQIMR